MGHTVTWGSLFGVGFIGAGVIAAGAGVLAIFAGGMSDAPADGQRTSSIGCFVAIGGAALLGLGVWMVR